MEHSVSIEYARCRGCTTCMKTCPTQAIRVRRGKATILDERCIDCGACIRSCPHKAIKAVSDPLTCLEEFQYTVALPDPALYSQFQNMDNIDRILDALTGLGFDAVYETAKGASLLTDYARSHPEALRDVPRPIISSACPAVLRLIQIRFPQLIGHIAATISPVELSAILARQKAVEETGLLPEQIGVFAIVPCSAQVTEAHSPGDLQAPVLDGAFSIQDLYLKLLGPMKRIDAPRPLSTAGRAGVRWAFCGGEASVRGSGERFLAVDGMDSVIQVLEAIEDDRITDVDFVELSACTKGCVGGCLTVENPFVAAMRLRHLIDGLPASTGSFDDEVGDPALIQPDKPLEFSPVLLLDEDRRAAMEKMAAIHDLERQLPGLLCGSCGAPSCHAFAEDVVLGRADRSDCIFQVRARMQEITRDGDPDDYLPTPFRKRRTSDKAVHVARGTNLRSNGPKYPPA